MILNLKAAKLAQDQQADTRKLGKVTNEFNEAL